MKYALLIYSGLTADEYGATVEAARQTEITDDGPWVQYTRAAREAGVLAGAEQLTHSETATSLRVDDGDRMVTDGPFMETKEVVGGFSVLEAGTIDEAIEIARTWPGVDKGWITVEVRPVMDMG